MNSKQHGNTLATILGQLLRLQGAWQIGGHCAEAFLLKRWCLPPPGPPLPKFFIFYPPPPNGWRQLPSLHILHAGISIKAPFGPVTGIVRPRSDYNSPNCPQLQGEMRFRDPGWMGGRGGRWDGGFLNFHALTIQLLQCNSFCTGPRCEKFFFFTFYYL